VKSNHDVVVAKHRQENDVAKLRQENDAREVDVDSILEAAAGRAKSMALSYAGAVTPREAYRLREQGEAVIVDVRTPPEWQFVGHVPDAPLIEGYANAYNVLEGFEGDQGLGANGWRAAGLPWKKG